jgi:fido (protein-threonine AMPylation protein)
MAEKDSHKDGSTRWIETSRGILSISEIAPLIAERVLIVEASIARGEFSENQLDEALLCSMHLKICGDLVPNWAGQWRKIDVKVGSHSPPAPHLIPLKMRDYVADLAARIASSPQERELPEFFLFVEGTLLSIHPLADFNGRVTRLWLSEIMRRFGLAPLILAPESPDNIRSYLNALRAADSKEFVPLANVWIERLGSWQ